LRVKGRQASRLQTTYTDESCAELRRQTRRARRQLCRLYLSHRRKPVTAAGKGGHHRPIHEPPRIDAEKRCGRLETPAVAFAPAGRAGTYSHKLLQATAKLARASS